MLPELGISEALNKLVTGKQATTRHDDLFYSNVNHDTSMNNMANWPVAKADEPKSFTDMSAKYTNDLTKNSPSSINSPSKTTPSGSGASTSNDKVIKAIGRGWDDTGDVFNATSKSLGSSKNYIDNIGKVTDAYKKSLGNYKTKTDEAVAGNKKLIEQNQKKDLDTLAGDTRKSIDNTNVMLGVKGASGGSASRAASRAISESAGKERAKTLTARGDQMSAQNLAAKNAEEDYNTKLSQADEWESTSRKQALDEFHSQEEALKRLKDKKSGWKDADIKAESDKNLSSLLASLNNIQTQSGNFRANLAAKITEYGGFADQLDTAAVGIDAPAELDTPKFSENIDLTDPNSATDFYDPNNTGKIQPKIVGYDALGNPIYDNAALADTPPVTA